MRAEPVPPARPARGRARRAALAAALLALAAAVAGPAPRAHAAAAAPRGSGESQIDETAPDESAAPPVRAGDAAALPERLRAFVEGSLARYDALKSGTAAFRRRGSYPSFFLRDPAADLELAPAAGGGSVVTAHLSYALRDIEQRLVIAPDGRLELPAADKRFFCELLGALAAIDPGIARARLSLWFAVLRPDGQMTWESRGSLGLPAAAARRVPAGSRTPAALWQALDENTLPAAILPEGW